MMARYVRLQTVLAVLYSLSTPFPHQVEFAKLLVCCQDIVGRQSVCILQLFEKVGSTGNVQNDRDCPLLFQLDVILLVPSSSILRTVSIVHECSSRCKFVQDRATTKLYEREHVQLSGSTFNHDYSNHLFCLNVYSLKLLRLQY